jgi:hypothetical protein
MSAYIVDRNHILYLLASAVSPVITPHGRLAWFHEGEWSEVHPGDLERTADVANMLWRENIASVSARYPNESSATLPGPCNEDCVIRPADFPHSFGPFNPVQVIKSCDCYEYQSCEHDGWKTSEASAFISALRTAAQSALPGYDEAAWGAPRKEAA